jgi:ribosomal protein S18 acetylase RimI-like enzyme
VTGTDEPTLDELPAGFVARRPRRDDIDDLVALSAAAELAAAGETSASRDELLGDWGQPRFDYDRNAWLVSASDGRLAAYAWVLDSADHTRVDGEVIVVPEHQWHGLEAPLLDWVERFARVLAAEAALDQRVSLGVWCVRGEPRGALYLRAGFARVRAFRRLRTALDDLPTDPLAYAPPPGLEIRRFTRDRDERAAWAADQEAFAEHFRFSAQPLDEWLRLCFTESADPDLWFLAWDGDEVAGLVISYVEPYGAYVAELAVRRPWRRRGLGRLLLLTAFTALRERGCATATLGVDSGNESGALGLYEGLGLHETLIHDFYEKTLRDGA